MFTEQNKSADVPTHDKHSDGDPHQGCTDGIYVTKILRGEEQRISPERVHKTTIDNSEHDEPEKQQHLVFPEMQEQQLNRKRKIKSFKPCFHE